MNANTAAEPAKTKSDRPVAEKEPEEAANECAPHVAESARKRWADRQALAETTTPEKKGFSQEEGGPKIETKGTAP